MAVLALLIAGGASANLLVNGDFEDPDLSAGTWQVVTNYGWSITTMADGCTDGGIEIRNGVGGSAYSPEQFAELDSTCNTGVGQTFNTIAGSRYVVSLAYSPGAGVAADSSGIEVWFGGLLLDELVGDGTNNSDNSWSFHTYNVTASSSRTSLELRATGVSDGRGGMVDLVSVTPAPLRIAVPVASIPEPATLSIVALGLLGLGALRRRSD